MTLLTAWQVKFLNLQMTSKFTNLSAEDVNALQSDPSNLVAWSKEWQNVDAFQRQEM